MRDIIQLACGVCKRRNYSTTKNKKKTTERLEMNKYCRFCREPGTYFVSLCAVCLRQKRQYLFISSRSVVLRLFFVVL